MTQYNSQEDQQVEQFSFQPQYSYPQQPQYQPPQQYATYSQMPMQPVRPARRGFKAAAICLEPAGVVLIILAITIARTAETAGGVMFLLGMLCFVLSFIFLCLI